MVPAKGLASVVTKSFGSLIEAKVKQINGLVSRNGGRGLINILLWILDLALPRRKSSYVAAVAVFMKLVSRWVATQGIRGAVIHLKAAHVLLMQSAAGNRVEDITDLKRRVKRTRGSGIPRFIPRQMRARIRDGDVTMFRVWSTLLSLYRVLLFRGTINTSTITNPGVEISTQWMVSWREFIETFFVPAFQQAAKLVGSR